MAIIQMEARVKTEGHEGLYPFLSKVADILESKGLEGIHIRVKGSDYGPHICSADITWQGATIVTFWHAVNEDHVEILRLPRQDSYEIDTVSERLVVRIKELAISVVGRKIIILQTILNEIKHM